MRNLLIIPMVAMIAASPAVAETKTTTIENERGTGTKVVTRDGQGNISIDAEVTRNSDGATASHSYERARTENGWTASGQQTDFQGRSRGFDYQRERTDNGFEASGSAYNRRGDEFEYSAHRTRDEDGRSRGRTVTRNGAVVYDRLDTISRDDQGRIVRDRSVTRDPSFRPKRRLRPMRPKHPRRPR